MVAATDRWSCQPQGLARAVMGVQCVPAQHVAAQMSWKRCNVGLNPNGIKLGITIDLFHGFSWMLLSASISCMYVVSKTPPYRRSPDGP
jgi:hypothetical protein